MSSTTFSGPVTSTNGFIGTISGAVKGDVQTVTTSTAANITTLATVMAPPGAGALAITLADGYVGQLKILTVSSTGGGAAVVTPATFANGSTLTFNAAADTCMLLFVETVGWTLVSDRSVAVA
tara:strand:- start:174 stop:542 length:369 start_codon:yes stop_codon:yes gene_type:complete